MTPNSIFFSTFVAPAQFNLYSAKKWPKTPAFRFVSHQIIHRARYVT